MRSQSVRFVALLALIVLIIIAFNNRHLIDPAVLEQWVNDGGILGPLIYILIYAISAVLFFPASVLTLTGGALFGPVLGSIFSITGATLGALLAFLVARHIASSWVEEKAGDKLKAIQQGIETEGWRFVAFVRLVPLFPFNLLNYALGLTRINVWHYVIASFVFMLPGAIAFTYLGHVGKSAFSGDEAIIEKMLIGLALVASLVFLSRFVRRMHITHKEV